MFNLKLCHTDIINISGCNDQYTKREVRTPVSEGDRDHKTRQRISIVELGFKYQSRNLTIVPDT